MIKWTICKTDLKMYWSLSVSGRRVVKEHALLPDFKIYEMKNSEIAFRVCSMIQEMARPSCQRNVTRGKSQIANLK